MYTHDRNKDEANSYVEQMLPSVTPISSSGLSPRIRRSSHWLSDTPPVQLATPPVELDTSTLADTPMLSTSPLSTYFYPSNDSHVIGGRNIDADEDLKEKYLLSPRRASCGYNLPTATMVNSRKASLPGGAKNCTSVPITRESRAPSSNRSSGEYSGVSWQENTRDMSHDSRDINRRLIDRCSPTPLGTTLLTAMDCPQRHSGKREGDHVEDNSVGGGEGVASKERHPRRNRPQHLEFRSNKAGDGGGGGVKGGVWTTCEKVDLGTTLSGRKRQQNSASPLHQASIGDDAQLIQGRIFPPVAPLQTPRISGRCSSTVEDRLNVKGNGKALYLGSRRYSEGYTVVANRAEAKWRDRNYDTTEQDCLIVGDGDTDDIDSYGEGYEEEFSMFYSVEGDSACKRLTESRSVEGAGLIYAKVGKEDHVFSKHSTRLTSSTPATPNTDIKDTLSKLYNPLSPTSLTKRNIVISGDNKSKTCKSRSASEIHSQTHNPSATETPPTISYTINSSARYTSPVLNTSFPDDERDPVSTGTTVPWCHRSAKVAPGDDLGVKGARLQELTMELSSQKVPKTRRSFDCSAFTKFVC